jgi:hypothetical protein
MLGLRLVVNARDQHACLCKRWSLLFVLLFLVYMPEILCSLKLNW